MSDLGTWLAGNREVLIVSLVVSLVSSVVAGFLGLVVGRGMGRRAERLAAEREAERLRDSLKAVLRRNVALVRSLPEALMIDSNPHGPDLPEIAATVHVRKRLAPIERQAVAEAASQLDMVDDLLRRFNAAQQTIEARRRAVEITQKVPDVLAACERAIEVLGGSTAQPSPPPPPMAA